MAEYIEREALIDAVESIDWYSVYKGKLTAGAPNTENALYKASNIYAAIDNVPAADVVEVRHGRWEWDTEDIYRCSNCAEKSHVKEVMGHPEWDYCPNCDAKMDGGDSKSAIA